MYIDEDTIRFYNPTYNYELETQDFPLMYPYRQMDDFTSFAQGPQGGPSSAPPNFTPSQPQSQQFGATPLAIDPGAIRPCLYRFVYIWPRRERGFWAWLTFVGPRSISGFRWNRNRWRFFGMDLRNINSFQCF
ncbi:hypothetical protein G9F73_006750 [Clostridium estertheticum]|uniref:hypothetical protein n=1 Tax=Clostridium estertheticum TaxID=238834 RepID=UPI001CCDF9C2|nr:hypothetical protein [Clostridium estertheticum]MBZ9607514.1 hypothetical protein [Clostridium estertheticum]